MIGWHFDQDDLDPVGVLDPHLSQSPGLGDRLPQNAGAGRGQALMFGVDIPYLEPEPYGVTGGACQCPETSRNPGPRKKTTPGSAGEPNSR